MMYEVVISETAERQLKKLERNIQDRILSTLERIKIRPEHFVERLVESGLYKLRIGDYRAILNLDKNKFLISVLKVGHRKNIYDKF